MADYTEEELLAAARGDDYTEDELLQMVHGDSSQTFGKRPSFLPKTVKGTEGAITEWNLSVDPDMTSQFNTKLSPRDESAFQSWLRTNKEKTGIDISLDLSTYDVRGFWKNSDPKEVELWAQRQSHAPDTYKKPSHPTFSDESIYNNAPDPKGGSYIGGHWDGETFVPNAGMNPVKMSDILDKQEQPSIGSTQPTPLWDVTPEWVRQAATPVAIEDKRGVLGRFTDYANSGALQEIDAMFGKPVPAFDIGTRELTPDEQRFENIPSSLQPPVGAVRGGLRLASKTVGMIPALLQGTSGIEEQRAKEFGFETPNKLREFIEGTIGLVSDLPTQAYYGAGRSIGLDPKDFIEESDKPAIRRGIESPEDAATAVLMTLGALKGGGRVVGAVEDAAIRAYPTIRNKIWDAKSRLMQVKVEMPSETPSFYEKPHSPAFNLDEIQRIRRDASFKPNKPAIEFSGPSEYGPAPVRPLELPTPSGTGEGFTSKPSEPRGMLDKPMDAEQWKDWVASEKESTTPVVSKIGKRIVNIEPLSAKVGKSLGVIGAGYFGYRAVKDNLSEEDVKTVEAGIDGGLSAATSMGLVAAGLAMGHKGKTTIEVPALAARPSVIGSLGATAEQVIRGIAKWSPSTAYQVATWGGAIQNPIRFFESIGKGAKELFYNPMRDLQHVSLLQTKASLDEFRSIMKDNGVGIFNKGALSERIAKYAISQQAGGMEALTKSGVDVPKLTDGEAALYNYMRQQLEARHPLINKVREYAGLDPIGYVDNYFMLWRNLDDVINAGKFIDKDAGWFNAKDIPDMITDEVAAKFVKERKIAGQDVEFNFDAFGDFEKYISLSTDYINKTPTLTELRDIATKNYGTASPHTATLQRAGQGTLGEGMLGRGEPFTLAQEQSEAFSHIREWLNHQAGIRKGFDNSTLSGRLGNKLTTKLTRNMARAGLSFNLQSTLIQPTAFVNFASQVGTRWASKGLEAMFSAEIRDQIMNKSKVMFGREHDVSITPTPTGKMGILGRAVSTTADIGLAPLKQLDLYTAEATWWGSYNKALSKLKLSEVDAITYADDMVIKTQGSASPLDVAQIQRHPLGRALTIYNTFVINNWGMLTQDIGGIGGVSKMTKTQRMAAAARYTFGSMAVNAMYDAAGFNSPIPNPITGYIERDRKTGKEGGLGGAALELVANVPVVGGGFRYGSSALGAIGQLGQDITSQPLWAGMKVLGVPGTQQIKKIATSKPTPTMRRRIDNRKRLRHQ